MNRNKWVFASILLICLLVAASIYSRSKKHRRHRQRHRYHHRPYYYRHRYYYRNYNSYPYYYFFPFITIYGQRDYQYYGEVYQEPPPLRRERKPRSPGSEYVWISGNWAWSDRWIWVEGEWVVAPREGATWQPGSWTRSRRGWVWVQGRWR